MIYYLVVILLILPFLIMFPTAIKGVKNIPKKGKVILVCNHHSNMDSLLIATKILRRRFKYMAKAELFKNKLVGGFLKIAGAYPVKRGGNDITAVKQTLKYLKQEKALCIFPEGTRVKENESAEAKNGAALFALKTNSPIVPCFYIKKPKLFRFNVLVIGQPFILSDMSKFKDKPITKDLLNEATALITEKMHELYDNYVNRKFYRKKVLLERM